MRLYLYVFICLPLLSSCQGSMSGRAPTQFGADHTGAVDLCAGQTAPSPQCPTTEGDKEGTKETPSPSSSSPTPRSTPNHEATTDTSPTYTNGKFDLKVTPWPHKINKDKDTEITLTFTAIMDIRKRGETQHGQLTHDIDLDISPYNAVKTCKVKAVSTLEHFKDARRPTCTTTVANSPLRIVEMQKGEGFSVTLIINASQDFKLGYLKKRPNGHNADLDRNPPQIQVE